jgi:hypothetical protein
LSLGQLNAVEFVVQKNIRSYRRFCAQAAYLRGDSDPLPPSMSMYAGDARDWRVNFNLLHRR